MTTYVIAVKRDFRDQISPDWAEALNDLEGLVIKGDPRRYRILAEASDQAIERAQDRVASFCLIEPLIEHFPLSGD